jgi:hypothetical protein
MNSGRDDRIWTCGPLFPKQVLYQAELHPENILSKMEQAKGIEPSYLAWQASALPLSYARSSGVSAEIRTPNFDLERVAA